MSVEDQKQSVPSKQNIGIMNSTSSMADDVGCVMNNDLHGSGYNNENDESNHRFVCVQFDQRPLGIIVVPPSANHRNAVVVRMHQRFYETLKIGMFVDKINEVVVKDELFDTIGTTLQSMPLPFTITFSDRY